MAAVQIDGSDQQTFTVRIGVAVAELAVIVWTVLR